MKEPFVEHVLCARHHASVSHASPDNCARLVERLHRLPEARPSPARTWQSPCSHVVSLAPVHALNWLFGQYFLSSVTV